MYSFRDNILIGSAKGRIVLIDDDHVLPEVILGHRISLAMTECLLAENSEDFATRLLLGKITSHATEGESWIRLLKEKYGRYLQEKEADIRQKELTALIHRRLREYWREEKEPTEDFRLDYPLHITYVPTWKCNRSCAYCGVPRIDQNLDCFPDLMERVEEAVDKGVQKLDIHGGEPLVYAFEQVEQLTKLLASKGVRVNVSTKNRLPLEKAKRLAEAGITGVQLSLDTTQEREAKILGYPQEYLEEFESSVAVLKQCRIPCTVNVVVSSVNQLSLGKLMEYLKIHEIPRITLSPLKVTERVRISPVSEKMYDMVQQSLTSYGRSVPFMPKERPVCEGGRSGLLLLANGRGAFCDFLADRSEFWYGDYRRQTLEEMWNDPRLLEMTFPDKSSFPESTCVHCEGWERCRRRGFCYLDAPDPKHMDKDRYCMIKQ